MQAKQLEELMEQLRQLKLAHLLPSEKQPDDPP
jgi:hypothetical protein